MTTANVEVAAHDGEIDIVVSGEIDLSNAESVQDDIFAAITNHLVAVHIDLSKLTYIDSAGLRILFALADRLRLLQTRCRLSAPAGSPIQRVIELSGLASLVDVHLS
ncbi:stage II sporulation protein AA (anti-sigma F factor antagonist) [Prauserella shujinwangii]|uniref:Anti-sigma factor antagonist n=1 Tax=Prauserella shujinwangii TaxID=1453103 RepID=A0A2T0M1A3_9PSEU|nr:STAS domain-containing protein [Prauserella shujinwangii]PRX50365.1 stage II sporulation protein AA (anti-sigma F factor antagonist) [Prauserella shujinwangii]